MRLRAIKCPVRPIHSTCCELMKIVEKWSAYFECVHWNDLSGSSSDDHSRDLVGADWCRCCSGYFHPIWYLNSFKSYYASLGFTFFFLEWEEWEVESVSHKYIFELIWQRRFIIALGHWERTALIHSFNTNLTIIRYVPALPNCPVHIFNVDIITSSNYIRWHSTVPRITKHINGATFVPVDFTLCANQSLLPPKWTCNYFSRATIDHLENFFSLHLMWN